MVLVTRPNHDLPTTYLYHFTTEIVNFCRKKSISLADLKGKKANKKLWQSYTNKNKLSFVFINGHGDENSVCGWDDEILIDKYERCYKNIIFYCRSCRSAKNLGKKMVKNGTRAYIGYTKDYYVLMSRKKNTKPLSDKTAKLFLDPLNLLVLSILKGNNVGEADKKSKMSLAKNIMAIISSDMKDKDEVAAYLLHDLKCQVVIGDLGAKI